MNFKAWIDGKVIRCEIVADQDLKAPIFRCSAIGPITVHEGATEVYRLGGYLEAALPDLRDGQPYCFALRFADPDMQPVNRAWLPLGANLTSNGRRIDLPALDTGARDWHPASQHLPEGILPLVPQPRIWRPSGGTLEITGVSGEHEALKTVDSLAHRQGMGPFVTANGCAVSVVASDLPEDAFHIQIGPEHIEIKSGSSGGTLYAAIVLLQLLRATEGRLPQGVLEDAPRFGWRGQHLDCARHFFAPATILDLLDLMALLRLNRFHWHFADDEAFRLEVDCFAELWRRTANRGEGELLPAFFGEDGTGGSYSKSGVQAIVAHAKNLNIEVLPEIEVPAHALAMTRVFPETRDPEDTGREESVQGYPANAMNPAMPKSWDVWHGLIDEIGPLFPFGHLHLGCDELPPGTWQGSPAAQELMAREGLQTTDDLQGWTMARLGAYARQRGLRPCAWEEAAKGANGGIGNGALLFSWTGQGPGLAAARAGYDVVMTPGQHAYLDMAASDDPDDWGAAWAAFISLEDTIAWDPLPAGAEDIADRIKGVQATFWGEFTTEDAQLWPMLMPRLIGIAMMGWQAKGTIDPGTLAALAGRFQTIWLPPRRI